MGGIPLDVVVKEGHSSTSQVASHPIERGAKISDHVWSDSDTLTIEGAIASSGGGFAVSGVGSRMMTAWAALKKLKSDAEPFSMVTSLELYDNLVFEELTADVDKVTGNTLQFTARLKRVIIVNSQQTAGTGTGEGAENYGKKTENLGKVSTVRSPSGSGAKLTRETNIVSDITGASYL